MDKTLVLLITAAVLVVGGAVAVVVDQVNGPQGPGSGDVIDYPEGPGSGDEYPEGPGSGDEIDTSEPTGPGSGDVIETPEGPGSGDVIDSPEGPGSGDEIDTSGRTGPGSGDEIDTIAELKKNTKGSCNAIAQTGNCVDYIGSYFSSWTNIKFHCSDPRAVPAKTPCPNSVLGGCRTGIGTTEEQVIWAYDVGVEAYLPENIGYARAGCQIVTGHAWVGGQ